MSGLIKSDAGALELVRALDAPPPVPPRSDADLRIQALERELSEIEQALQQSDAQRLQDLALAREAGRAEAVRDFRDGELKRQKTLESAINRAIEQIEARLGQAEKLGLDFALAALEHVVGDPDRRRELVRSAIERQTRGLRRGTLLAVRVSDKDFGDTAALTALAPAEAVSVCVDANLESGACRLALRLGEVDISLPRFMEELRACCRQLAGES
jgi:flagellar biosynthesis/type III secretory pathway protein FliH